MKLVSLLMEWMYLWLPGITIFYDESSVILKGVIGIQSQEWPFVTENTKILHLQGGKHCTEMPVMQPMKLCAMYLMPN